MSVKRCENLCKRFQGLAGAFQEAVDMGQITRGLQALFVIFF
jgi:hypothetical protein